MDVVHHLGDRRFAAVHLRAATVTIRVTCDGDGCGKSIDRDVGGWFGVDYTPPPVEVEVEEVIQFTEVIQLGADHEFHFCSADCVVSWAFSRSFTPQPEGTTT